jgi:eukaryotic-like serine/threonine-protein kinase
LEAPSPFQSESETFGTATAGVSGNLPVMIGKFKIRRLIGEGGMGAVYEAEQEQPRRTVALKVIKTAWASPGMV